MPQVLPSLAQHRWKPSRLNVLDTTFCGWQIAATGKGRMSGMMRIAKGLVRLSGLQRTHVAAARMFCERHALATMPASPKREGGRILCYHSIGQPECGVNDVTPMQFRRHIEFA